MEIVIINHFTIVPLKEWFFTLFNMIVVALQEETVYKNIPRLEIKIN
ncbi:hypothetical protein KDN24_00890 [Bacillus sp. Bva_UNVM-123]